MPTSSYRLGSDEFSFVLQVSSGNVNLFYVYSDPIKAVGLIHGTDYSRAELENFISPGRVVRPTEGQSVVLMNDSGHLCVVKIEKIQDEVDGHPYTAPYVVFSYEIITDV